MKPKCSDSNSSSRSSQRRKRTFFTNKQLDRLEEVFQQDRFPGIETRERLTDELGIREDRIQVWFQNRRARWRRHEIKNKPAPSVTDRSPPVTPSWPETDSTPGLPVNYLYSVPQFTYPTQLHEHIPPAFLFPYPLNNEVNWQFPSPDSTTDYEPTTNYAPHSCHVPTTYRLTHNMDEYAAAAGLLSVVDRQN